MIRVAMRNTNKVIQSRLLDLFYLFIQFYFLQPPVSHSLTGVKCVVKLQTPANSAYADRNQSRNAARSIMVIIIKSVLIALPWSL